MRYIARNSLLYAKGIQMTEKLAIGAVGQIARRVKDIEAARRWYGDVLGLQHLYSFGDLAFFDCGGLRLFLSQNDNGNKRGSVYNLFPRR